MNHMKLVPYARGMVVENKLPSTNEVLVVPIEILPQINGELAVEDVEVEDSGIEGDGKTYTVKIKQRAGLRCGWIPLGSNRITAPDVRRGERVIIYRYADQDKYYWKEIGLDDNLRRLETAIWRFSDVPDGESDEELNVDNAYYLTVSTHTGLIEISTCKANGEPFAYKIQLNTKEGVYVVSDDAGNYIQLDSSETCITLENANKTYLKLDKDEIIGSAITNIKWTAGENIEFKAKKDVVWDIGGKRVTNIKETDYVKSGGDSTHISANYAITTGAFGVSASSGIMSASFKIHGTLLTTGASTFSSAMEANGITSTSPISGPTGTI